MADINVNDLLGQMRAMAALAQGQATSTVEGGAAPGFGTVLKQAVDSVNATQQNAAQLSQSFELGDPNVSLAEVMLSMQKASLSFQAMNQVRNKLVSAYQEIMNMSV
jgi:flagellar hook-basal body complex protein FliE